MESISLRCLATGIGVLTGLVDTHEPFDKHPSEQEIRHVRPLGGRYGAAELVDEQI